VTKHYNSRASLRQKILSGVNVLADNVASTLGPRGRNVILQNAGGAPVITKDGVTVAEFVTLDDPFENAAAQVIKQAAAQTNSMAGDGTTTATVLAREVLIESQRYITSGVSPVELKRGMDSAVASIVACLEEMSQEISSVEEVANIATISANNDKVIGDLIATAVDKAGKNGAITIEEARSLETSLDLVEGFRFDAGYAATAFINDERRGVVKYTEEPLILVSDYKIDSVEQILPILEVVARESRPFIIISEEIEGQALAALIMNAMRGTMKIAAVKAPRYGEERRNVLKDLAISVGATLISRESGVKLNEAKLEHLGLAKSIEITKNDTTIMGGKGTLNEIEERITALKAELENTESMHECERIQERITRLASGIAIIRVGASTEVEMIEKKHRIEDALEAVRSAREEGIVPGGGVALIRAAEQTKFEVDNEDQAIGVEIVRKAVYGPLRQMAKNAGESPDIIQTVVDNLEKNQGFDFRSRTTCDLFENGIIDPAKVTRCALQNAVSAAGTLITTNYAIIKS
jgi:chaperonin GroEL